MDERLFLFFAQNKVKGECSGFIIVLQVSHVGNLQIKAIKSQSNLPA